MEWRKIPGTAGYEASEGGQIRSPDIEQTLQGNGGTTYTRRRAGRVLKLAKHSAGYLKCCVVTAEGRQSQRTVHSLVLEAFLGPRPKGLWINHRNGIKTDNRLENLEYCSASDNQRHAVATGLAPKPPLRRGTDNDHICRLNEEQVRSIRRDYAEGRGIAGLAREYRVGDSTVRNIVRRNSWAWLSDE